MSPGRQVGSEGGAIVNITSISAHASTPLLAYAPGKAAVASLTACLAAGGAKHWAVIASLIETCKLNGVEPLGYLADVLTRIVNGHPTARSTISSRGPTSALPSSGPWPENIAYDSALPVSLGQALVILP